MKNNKFKIMTAVGVIALGIGALGYDYTPSADAALEAQCRTAMQKRNLGEMANRCTEKAFASAMTATNANDVARAISGANQQGILGHMGASFCLGLGAVLALIGVLGMFGIVKPRKA